MMHRISQWRIAFLVMALLSGGCAFGHKYNYHESIPSLQVAGSGSVSVATHDQRPYVVSGAFGPQFVGLTRGGYGNPFGVETQSGRALAADMTHVICTALIQKGWQCVQVLVAANQPPDEVRQRLRRAPGERALLLTLHEWKSDTYVGSVLLYSVTLSVLDKRSTVLAEAHLEGREGLGSNFWNPVGVAYKAVPQAYKATLEELLNQPDVIAALQTLPRS